MLAPYLVTAPAVRIITREEAKRQCQIEAADADFDDLLDFLILAAEAHLDGRDGILGRGLAPQTWGQQTASFPRKLRFALDPVREVSAIKYFDAEDAPQTVAAGDLYHLLRDARGSYLDLKSGADRPAVADRPDAVTFEYAVGYDEVPPPIRQAALFLVGHWFANRETVVTGTISSEVDMTTRALLRPFLRAWA